MCYIPYRTQTTHFPKLPYPPPYFGYPDWESVTLCKNQHYPTLDTYLSLSFHSDTLPEYLTLPYQPQEKYPSLHWVSVPLTPSTSQLTYLYPPHNTFYYPNLHFPTLYYCQGFIKYMANKAETTQDRNDSGRNDPGRNDSGPKWLRAETKDPSMQLLL